MEHKMHSKERSSNNKAIFWSIAIFIYIFVPLILWLQLRPIGERFIDADSTLRSLGQLFGLFGISLFALNFLLAARLKTIDRLLSGMNVVYVNHHVLGGIAFILLLGHPIFLVIRYMLSSISQALNLIIPNPAELDVFLGILGLLLMMSLLVITFYWRPKYDKWKLTHKFLGLAFILGFVHMLLVPSDVSNSLALKIYYFVIGALAIAALVYRSVLPMLIKKYKYSVTNVKALNPSFTTIELEPCKEEMRYVAGQFAFLRISDFIKGREEHPFSIASSGRKVRFVIKSLGDYTSHISSVKKGDIAEIEGPFGIFSPTIHSSKKQIWIAGGVGITPFLGLILDEDLKDVAKITGPISLYHSVKNKTEAVYLNELYNASLDNNFRFTLWPSDEKGYLNAESILKSESLNSFDISDVHVFICGPLKMMQSMRADFKKAGIPDINIHSEEFQL